LTPIHIQRYYCKKGKKTISFLPKFLIPYHRYPIEFIFNTLRHIKKITQEKKLSQKEILDNLSCETTFKISDYSLIKHFEKMIEVARNRYNSLIHELFDDDSGFFTKCLTEGAIDLKEKFYNQTDYFLFGNASQHR
jgi:hypothetical protein